MAELSPHPFVLSLSKHGRATPFDKLRVNGDCHG